MGIGGFDKSKTCLASQRDLYTGASVTSSYSDATARLWLSSQRNWTKDYFLQTIETVPGYSLHCKLA